MDEKQVVRNSKFQHASPEDVVDIDIKRPLMRWRNQGRTSVIAWALVWRGGVLAKFEPSQTFTLTPIILPPT